MWGLFQFVPVIKHHPVFIQISKLQHSFPQHFDSHVAKGDLSQQQEAYRFWLGSVTVVCTLGHHVGKVHTFAEHVTRLEHNTKMKRLNGENGAKNTLSLDGSKLTTGASGGAMRRPWDIIPA